MARLVLVSAKPLAGKTTIAAGLAQRLRVQGKSVALNCPCGSSSLSAPSGPSNSSGRVTLSGAPPANSLNPFTYIFQDFALLPWRSVADNVGLALEHRGLGASERRERIAASLAMTGLSDFATAYPKQLSGGMRQRVGRRLPAGRNTWTPTARSRSTGR